LSRGIITESFQLDGRYADVNAIVKGCEVDNRVIVEFLEHERDDPIVTGGGTFCTLVDGFPHFILKDWVIVI